MVRQARGESQEAIARKAGVALGTLVRIENGHNEPTIDTLQRIADALEVDLMSLIAEPAEAAEG
jgi:transcriptional regulator with XRE-family HTH domain